eukprot:1326715-Prorocentrum_lima.AAC.1
MDASALIQELHGQALRAIANGLGQHFHGLAQAARAAKRHGYLDNVMLKRLLQVDFAFNLVRHITTPSLAS